MSNILYSLALIIITATFTGFIARLLRQPLIPAYILGGMILGPAGLGLLKNAEEVQLLSEIGIAFLLFIVGLELDFSRLKDIGMMASLGTVIQIVLLSSIGLMMALLFPLFSFIEGIYLGLVVSFSSTMVVIKILSDKKELETLHGRIIIGVLLMEDFIALFVLSILGGLEHITLLFFFMALLKATVLIWVTVLSSRYVFPALFRLAARSQEILFLLSITVCFLFAFFALHIGKIFTWLLSLLPIFIPQQVLNMIAPGFSIAIGAFFGGVSLANLPYNFEIVSRITPLRDFFATLFFASIGIKVTFSSLAPFIWPLITFVLFVVLFKPFITMVISNTFGYAPRTSFLAALALAQASEFSLIIADQGLALGHISQEFFSMVIILSVTTIIISSYYIKFDKQIFQWLSPYTKSFMSIGAPHKRLEFHEERQSYNVILAGYDRIGYSIIKTVRKLNRNLLVIDFNPDVIKRLMREHVPCMYGDIGDIELLERIDFSNTDVVISTIPEIRDNDFLLRQVKTKNPKLSVIVTANRIEEALELYDYGADYVILPHFLGGDHLSLMLEDMDTNMKKIINTKLQHIEELKKRRQHGHEHPRHHRRKKNH